MATTYEKVFGHKAVKTKKRGKRRTRKARRRERRVIRKLQAEHDKRYIQAIVMRGLVFKADLQLNHALAVARGDRLNESEFKERLPDGELRIALQYNAIVRHKAKKKLARKGVQLDAIYDDATFSCKPGQL